MTNDQAMRIIERSARALRAKGRQTLALYLMSAVVTYSYESAEMIFMYADPVSAEDVKEINDVVKAEMQAVTGVS